MDLDEKYLGKKLPRNPEERKALLRYFQDILTEKGVDYVTKNRELLLEQAQEVLDMM